MAVPLRSSAVRDRADEQLWSRYRTHLPDTSVHPYSGRGWTGEARWDRSIRLLPDGCVDLVARNHRVSVVVPAPEVRRIRLRAADRPTGLRVRCGAAGALLGSDLADLAGGEYELADLVPLPGIVRRALDAGDPGGALAAFVRARLGAGHPPDPVVLHAVAELRHPGARVDRVADQVGLSPRTLQRRVSAEVGFSPKQLQRVFRFHRVLRRLPLLAGGAVALAGVAVDCGYADQSHLGRDCRRLAGASPAELVASWSR